MRQILIIIGLLGSLFISAQVPESFDIAGRVTDENDLPLPGANVFLPELEKGTVTGLEGEFYVQGLPAGRFILKISFMGYETHIQNIQPDGPEVNIDISMNPALIAGGEVVISGGRHSTQHENAIKIELMEASEIKQGGSSGLIEALSRMPGVDMISRGGGVTAPVIRGLATSNILVLNNGFRLENYQFSSDHPYLVDESGLQQVEVIKGPASLLYGSDAIGGVINLVHDNPAPPQSVISDADVKYFSNTEGLEGNLGVQGSQGKISWGFRGGYKSHKDYTDGKGQVIPNSRFNGGSLKTYAGFRTMRSMHRLAYEYQKLKPGLTNEESVEILIQEGRYNEFWFQDLDNHLLTLNNKFFLNPFRLQANFSYQHNHRRLIADETDHLAVNMQLQTLSYEFRGNLVTSDVSEFTFAVQGLTQGNRNSKAEQRVLPDYRLNDLAVFGLVQHDFENDVHLQVGFRFDNRFLYAPEQEKSGHSHEEEPGQEEETMPVLNKYYGNVSGSLGVTWMVTKRFLLRGNLASAYRAPNIAELTQDGAHGVRHEEGNRDLKSQRNYEMDISAHLHGEVVLLDLACFYNRIPSYIYLDYSNDTTDEGLPVYRYVQNDAALYGLEGILEILPFSWLSMKMAGNITRGIQTNGSNLPFIPQDRLRFEFRWKPSNVIRKGNFYLMLGYDLVFAQDHPSIFETSTLSYQLLHAGAGISIPVSDRKLSLDLHVNNLLNTAYMDHLSVIRELGFYNKGRSINVHLSIPLLTSAR